MATKKTPVRCVACGADMVHETRPDSVSYKGQTRAFQTLAWWCTSCNEAILDGEALKKSEAVFLELRATVDGVLSAEQVASVRKKLKLSQAKASDLLGGGPRAFQKYESGKTAVSVPMSNLLRLLDRDPKRLRELESIRDSASIRTSAATPSVATSGHPAKTTKAAAAARKAKSAATGSTRRRQEQRA